MATTMVQKQLRRLDSWRALHWAIIILSALVVGPLCSHPFLRLTDHDGGHAVSMLVSSDFLHGLLTGGAVLGGAAVVALLAAYCCSAGVAFASAGLVLAWGAWRTTDVDALIRRTRSTDDLPRIAVENGLVVLLVALLAVAVMVVTHERTKSQTTPKNRIDGVWRWFLQSAERDVSASKVGLGVVLVTSIAVGLVASVACISASKGQAVFAALVGGIAAGWASQLMARAMHCTPTPALVVLGCLLPAIAGPALAIVLQGSTITTQLFAGNLFPLAQIMPFDWATGAMLGVPVGLSWAGVMIDQRAAEE